MVLSILRKTKPKVFFDASVIFSAVYSPKGASFQLSILTKEEKIVGVTSQTAIDEVIDNIGKFKKEPNLNIVSFISDYNFLVREAITIDEIQSYKHIVEEKDAHVLAGAILTGSNYLVTLDKKRLDNPGVKSKVSNIRIISPRELYLKLKSTISTKSLVRE